MLAVNAACYLPARLLDAWDAADQRLADFYADMGREGDDE